MGVRVPDSTDDTTPPVRYVLEVVKTATGYLPRWQLDLPPDRMVSEEELHVMTEALYASIDKVDEVYSAVMRLKQERDAE